MSKSIYTFTVDKVSKVPKKTEEKYKDKKTGEEKTRVITEDVEEKVQVEFLLKKPNRKQMQDAEMVFSIEMSRCIKLGILTKAMLLNKYTDTGGLVSKEDQGVLDKAYTEYNDMRKELTVMSAVPEKDRTKEQKEELEQKQRDIIALQKQIVESEASYLTLFNHTADTKAQNKIILWYILNLAYYKDPSQKHEDFVKFFSGDTFEEMEEHLYAMEESEDDLYTKAYPKLATVLSFWYFSGTTDKEEFDKALKEQYGEA